MWLRAPTDSPPLGEPLVKPRSILPAVWQVPQELRDRLGAIAGRQRAMMADGHLLLVLHAPPKPEDDEREGRFFWRRPDGEWLTSQDGNGLGGLERHINQYDEWIERFEEEIQSSTTAENYFDVIEALSPLHRAARHMHQALQEARKLVPQDRELLNQRDQAYNTERTAELLFEGARHSLNFAIAKRTEDQARTSHRMAVSAHRLNTMAALFLPIATFSAVLGMNVRHGLEDTPGPLPFAILVGVGLVMGVATTMIINSRSNHKSG